MVTKMLLAGCTALSALAFSAGIANAVELRFQCYQDGNECQAWSEEIKKFEAKNPDIKVAVDEVPYKAILESLPVQLASGSGPDLARVSDLGGLAKYMLDLRPHLKDADYWEKNYGDELKWTRVNGPNDNGIYNLPDQLTITGPFVNKTLFDQAGVAMPGDKATWDDWAKAAVEVAKKTKTPYPMAMDRSGHRFAGPAISYGAKYFDGKGNPITVDDGFKAFAEKFVKWNKDGTMAKDVWAGSGGATYQDASQEFINATLVFYLSGSWQVARFGREIGDAFDWEVVNSPCGPAACTGIPGGASVVGFKHTKHPEAVAKLLDFMAQEDVYADFIGQTKAIPANKSLQEKRVDYPDADSHVKKALAAFTIAAKSLSPRAFEFQGYKNNRAIMNATAARITQAIVGESTLDQALDRINADIAEAVKASGGAK
ncbi:ABC transporter substrate-binding protein [Jiella sp. MQZ9-1]|uniref:Carbohydrate ABC transporter substrate-binding protein n=1 Tax=Jiella flava TaxID=2816857 RepID=A0A939FUS0_9HYPH|nr:ABC transporter substrate-binding protein [Jiella flava]MBO0661209.1 carbohydrate ABC transporter substrate-binding protein [Jiella flava]MCD2469854.1 ABC transporter substrate-binding protein [Jiella flava]